MSRTGIRAAVLAAATLALAVTDGVMGRASRFSPEVPERAIRMVLEHREEHSSARRRLFGSGSARRSGTRVAGRV
jgi:hypothetical protein